MSSNAKLRFGKELDELIVSDIQTLINNKIDECQNLEFKQPSEDAHKDCNNLGEEISSFLNTDGGLLVYGVAEIKEGEHRFASEIVWSKVAKERLENTLISIVQPWFPYIKIKRIANKDDQSEAIYVIDVPKSSNPPHMFLPRGIYYQRLNFRNQIMAHESVYRAFQSSWIQRKDIINKVVIPLYSEIKGIVESLENLKYEYPDAGDSSYNEDVRLQYRYLYDKIDRQLKEKIDLFYAGVGELVPKLGFEGFLIVNNIINKELVARFPEEVGIQGFSHSFETLFLMVNILDINGDEKARHEFSIYQALFRKRPLREYIETELGGKVVSFVPIVKQKPEIR